MGKDIYLLEIILVWLVKAFYAESILTLKYLIIALLEHWYISSHLWLERYYTLS